MSPGKIPERIDLSRRYFVGAGGAPPSQFGFIGSADAQSNQTGQPPQSPLKAASNSSFGPLKQIDAGVLNVTYAEAGPVDGPPVILLHGWPYDIYSFVDVAPLLASAGYRVIVPYLRGYGGTRFLSTDTARNGQPSAIAVDTIALMDALKIDKAILAGFDWGARTVNIVSALWPERCKATVSVSGYLIGSQQAAKMPLPPNAELQWWYQYYFATDAARPAMTNTGTTFQSLSGNWLRRDGRSTMPPSTAPLLPLTIPIMSPSWSTIIAGDSAWRKARRSTTAWNNGLPNFQS